jgi:hypothetical protein
MACSKATYTGGARYYDASGAWIEAMEQQKEIVDSVASDMMDTAVKVNMNNMRMNIAGVSPGGDSCGIGEFFDGIGEFFSDYTIL